MGEFHDFDEVDAFTVGAVGRPGQRVFLLQARRGRQRVTVKCEKQQAAAIADAESMGTFESVTEADLFDDEYWSLEQAKLGKSAEKRLQRHVVLVTGGGSGIGAASVAAFAAEGCEVVTFDHEHVPPAYLEQLEALGVAVRPGPAALFHAQDKIHMRQSLTDIGVPCPRWRVRSLRQ
jgi:hypothetical protein